MKKIGLALFLLAAQLYAANNDIFDDATNKVDSFNTGLAALGVAILTLAISISAAGAWLGWFSKANALRIFGGGIFFGSASTIAAWLIG